MARQFKEFFELPDYKKVGYTLSKRKKPNDMSQTRNGGYWFVRFIGPRGTYQRFATGMKEEGQARNEAYKIVLRMFCPQQTAPITWDEMLDKLKAAMVANGNRLASYQDYAGAIRAIRVTLPETTGPLDIDEPMAQRFKDQYVSGTYKRSKAKDAKQYPRSLRTFNTYLQAGRIIWKKWLKAIGVTTKANPWQSVFYARLNRKMPHAPDEQVLVDFFQYVKGRYPNWDLPILFLKTKCFLGCRLNDLCTVRTNQLKNDAIEFNGDQTKDRGDRRVVLPENLYRALDALKGKEYLWEKYTEQYRDRLNDGKWYCKVKPSFAPKTLYSFIQNLFKDFQRATGKKLNSHMLRKRAITKLYKEKVRVEEAAERIGMDVKTLLRYYLDMKKIDSSDKLSKMADTLIPPI